MKTKLEPPPELAPHDVVMTQEPLLELPNRRRPISSSNNRSRPSHFCVAGETVAWQG